MLDFREVHFQQNSSEFGRHFDSRAGVDFLGDWEFCPVDIFVDSDVAADIAQQIDGAGGDVVVIAEKKLLGGIDTEPVVDAGLIVAARGIGVALEMVDKIFFVRLEYSRP